MKLFRIQDLFLTTCFSILSFCTQLGSFAQTLKPTRTQLSDPIEFPENYDCSTGILCKNEKKILIVQNLTFNGFGAKSKSVHKIVEYDLTTLTPNNKEIEIYRPSEVSPSQRNLDQNYKLFVTRNSIIQVFSEHSSKTKSTKFYYRIFSKNLETAKSLSLAFEYFKPQSQGINLYNQQRQLEISLNQDSTGILFLIEGAKAKNEKEKLKIIQISETGELTHTNDVQFPRESTFFTIKNIYSLATGKFIVSAYVNIPKSERNESGFGILNAFYTFEKDDVEAEEFIPTYEDGIENVKNVEYIISQNEVKLIGLCSSKNQSGTTGIVVKMFNLEKEEWTKEIYSSIPNEILEEAKKTGIRLSSGEKKQNSLYSNYIILNIYNQKTGFIVVCQNQTSYEQTIVDKNGNRRTITTFVFGNYVIFKFDENGTLDWVNSLNQKKESYSSNPFSTNYPMFPEEEGITVIIDDYTTKTNESEKGLLNLNKYNVETAFATYSSAEKPDIKTINSNFSSDYTSKLSTSLRINSNTYLMLGRYDYNFKSKDIKKGDVILVKVQIL